MRRTGKVWAVAAALVLALVALPAGAAAKPFVIPASTQATIHLKGTNGFRVEFQVVAARGHSRPSLYVIATRGPATGEYLTAHEVSFDDDGSIAARLAGVGRVEVSFRPIETVRSPAIPTCKGRPEVTTEGVFKGTIHFRGRQGFTSADASAARGSIVHSFGLTCPESHESGSESTEEEPSSSLIATGKSGGSEVTFFASEFGSGETGFGPLFNVFASTASHGVFVFGSVHARGGASTFAIPGSDSLEASSVDPPHPFTGSAEFHLAGPRRSTWTGNLAVDIPGFGPTRLAGPEFRSSLCVDEDCAGSTSGKSKSGSTFGIVTVGRPR